MKTTNILLVLTALTAPVVCAQSLTVSPAGTYLATGTQLQLSAQVSGVTPATVKWEVVGGALNGSVTTAGLYTAPSVVPSQDHGDNPRYQYREYCCYRHCDNRVASGCARTDFRYAEQRAGGVLQPDTERKRVSAGRLRNYQRSRIQSGLRFADTADCIGHNEGDRKAEPERRKSELFLF